MLSRRWSGCLGHKTERCRGRVCWKRGRECVLNGWVRVMSRKGIVVAATHLVKQLDLFHDEALLIAED